MMNQALTNLMQNAAGGDRTTGRKPRPTAPGEIRVRLQTDETT